MPRKSPSSSWEVQADLATIRDTSVVFVFRREVSFPWSNMSRYRGQKRKRKKARLSFLLLLLLFPSFPLKWILKGIFTNKSGMGKRGFLWSKIVLGTFFSPYNLLRTCFPYEESGISCCQAGLLRHNLSPGESHFRKSSFVERRNSLFRLLRARQWAKVNWRKTK